MLKLFRQLSIQHKLIASLGACLVVFMLISGGLGAWLIGNAVRDRVVSDELPTTVNAIRADVQRQIAEPLTSATAVAGNTFLHQWESQGLSDEGLAQWKSYAKSVKAQQRAASVFWISQASGKYFTEEGLNRQLTDKDQWFTAFMNSGKPYSLDIAKENGAGGYMLFINARMKTEDGKLGAAGLGLAIDELARTIGGYKIGATGFAFLVRADGSIMMHSDATLVDGSHFLKGMPGLTEPVAQALLGGKPFSHATIQAPGGDRFIASSFIPELNAYVIVEVPQSELLGPVNRAIQIATVLAALVGGAIALVIILLVSRAIAGPVRRAATLLTEIADGHGDLTRRMDVETGDEVGQLAEAFNRFVSSLSELVQQVRASSDSIATGSSEISSGNADLSQRTEEQASNLQQTAASMEQLTATVKQNADNARTAAQLASGASAVAARGSTVVGQVVQTMQDITSSSRQVADIISVIDGIAFQTNILALNAAVEAARAGEQGRGFAVVASEVRALAQRSAGAAKEIKTLIEQSVERVGHGATQVAEAGNTMEDIMRQVGRVNDLVGEISSASVEQSQGIGQVGDAVAQLDQVTQQNAALVEESAAAAESLKHQAARLAQLMSVFNVGTTAAH